MPTAVDVELLATFGLIPGRRRGYVYAAPVVAHVLALEKLGWTYERTSITAGLATCSVRQMLRQGNELIMARRAVAIIQIPLKEFRWKQEIHGELSCWRNGCRCEFCRETNKRRMKAWHHSRNRHTRMVDAESVRLALQEALDDGLTTWTKTYEAIGGSGRTLTLLLAGRYSLMRQPTVKRITAHIAECRKRADRIVVDLCLVCGWPLEQHHPYYVHIEPARRINQPSDNNQQSLVTSKANQNRYKRQADRLRPAAL